MPDQIVANMASLHLWLVLNSRSQFGTNNKLNPFNPSIANLDLWQWRAKLEAYFGNKLKNVVQRVNRNNSSLNIFPSTI
jgi:hypothetical protein